MDSNVGNEMIPPFIPPETAWSNDAPVWEYHSGFGDSILYVLVLFMSSKVLLIVAGKFWAFLEQIPPGKTQFHADLHYFGRFGAEKRPHFRPHDSPDLPGSLLEKSGNPGQNKTAPQSKAARRKD